LIESFKASDDRDERNAIRMEGFLVITSICLLSGFDILEDKSPTTCFIGIKPVSRSDVTFAEKQIVGFDD
jgi:hypothetical protein